MRISGFVENSKDSYDKIYEKRQQFLIKNPCPVETVLYCSYDYPMYVLAVPGTKKSCCRGEAVEFKPEDLIITEEQKSKLIKFCSDYGIETNIKPCWNLVSVMG